MTNILAFSGGKDSQACWLWAIENLKEFQLAFCDTKWEHPFVYEHNKYLEQKLGKKIKVLQSNKYDGFADLCIKKKRVASLKARFCTEELKVKPMIDYILSIQDDVTIIQGVRNDESEARRNLKMKDEYFKFYLEPHKHDKKGKPVYHTYRRKEVLSHLDKFTVDVLRPIIKFTAIETIEYSISRGVKINPLYFNGMSRVGCFPCVSCRKSEIEIIADRFPERIDLIRDIENATGRTFFPPSYIPDRFCDRSEINKKGEKVYYATIDAVISYVNKNKGMADLFNPTGVKGCISVYNICEV